jgi:inorganic pyrophosphatase
MSSKGISALPVFDDKSGALNVIIETPKGSRTKLKYLPEPNVFRVEKSLPVGMVFPFDFGFLPSTRGEDGDPLDVLLVGDEAVPVGCLVLAKLIGVLKCEQTENGKTERNDRLIAVPVDAGSKEEMKPSIKLDRPLTDSIVQFFVKYNELLGRKLKPLGTHGPEQAMKIVEEGRTGKQGSKRARKTRKK